MTFTKFTATTVTALLLGTAAVAQESGTAGDAGTQAAGQAAGGGQTFDVVFIDVGGSAVQVPLELAAQACALGTEEIQQLAQTRLDEQGLMPADAGFMASADASGAGTTGTDAANTTQTADANATTDMGNATTDTTQTAEAGATGDAAATEATTEMAASGDAATGTGQVENVETTAADTTAAAGDTSTDPDQAQDPFLVLAVCAIDAEQATALNIDTTQTGETLGLDASRLQPAANQ